MVVHDDRGRLFAPWFAAPNTGAQQHRSRYRRRRALRRTTKRAILRNLIGELPEVRAAHAGPVRWVHDHATGDGSPDLAHPNVGSVRHSGPFDGFPRPLPAHVIERDRHEQHDTRDAIAEGAPEGHMDVRGLAFGR